jgi:hypothetical protein
MPAQFNLMKLKETHLKSGRNDDSFGTLGWRYWLFFLVHNSDIISSKKTVRFDSRRDDWCRLDNLKDMYNGVCNKLADAGIAEVLHDEVWLDRHGNTVQTQAESYGKKY